MSLAEHCGIAEAVTELAERVELELPSDEDGIQSAAYGRMLDLNSASARYYRDVLLSQSGKPGMDYLLGRQLKPGTIRKYGLGYAHADWHNLHHHLKKKGYSDKEMEEAALVVRHGNSVYDKFRSRVMFPIINKNGDVVGFGGRTLEKKSPAKYIQILIPLHARFMIPYSNPPFREMLNHRRRTLPVNGVKIHFNGSLLYRDIFSLPSISSPRYYQLLTVVKNCFHLLLSFTQTSNHFSGYKIFYSLSFINFCLHAEIKSYLVEYVGLLVVYRAAKIFVERVKRHWQLFEQERHILFQHTFERISFYIILDKLPRRQ